MKTRLLCTFGFTFSGELSENFGDCHPSYHVQGGPNYFTSHVLQFICARNHKIW